MVFPLSVEFYHKAGRLALIGEDVELLEGVLFTKLPKPPFHEWLCERLMALLQLACTGSVVIAKERPIACANSEPEPDLGVFKGISMITVTDIPPPRNW